MNLKFYFEKLKSSDTFKKFTKENPTAYFCSGFFTIDKEGSDNQRHLDFYIPETKKMFNFMLNNGVEISHVEIPNEQIPNKLNFNIDFSFEEIENMIAKEMEKQGIKNKLQKIIASLQDINNKPALICTVFVSMLGLLKVEIDIKTMKIMVFEKKSFFDLMKIVKK